ncbi:MAG: PQQ-binding-like beta-propeller repeat protein [Verrucomicrobiota bacterium]
MLKAPCLLLLAAFFGIGLLLPATADVTGWRTDGTSHYPQAQLPAKWGPDAEGKWKLKTEQWSNATPVVVGDIVFITEEPTKLVAVDLNSGEKLWEKSHLYEEVLGEDQLAFFKGNDAEAQRLITERNKLNRIGRMLRKKEKEQVEAGDDERALLTVRAEQKANREKIREISDALAKNPGLAMPPAHKVNGHASYTPVSDGVLVVAAFGNGVVAAYDLNGKRKWARWVQNPDHQWGGSVSPAIAGGKVIVRFDDHVALDLATGEEVWRLPGQQSFGSPVVVESGGLPFYISARGEIIDVEAGKMVESNAFNMADHRLRLSAPVVKDGVIYAADGIQGGGPCGRVVAVKVPDNSEGEWEKLWETPTVHQRHYASPLVAGEILYTLAEDGTLSLFNLKDGSQLATTKLEGLKRRTYPSPVLAGKQILISDEHGNAIALEPGKAMKAGTTAKVSPYRSTPIFTGETMLVRNLDGLSAF